MPISALVAERAVRQAEDALASDGADEARVRSALSALRALPSRDEEVRCLAAKLKESLGSNLPLKKRQMIISLCALAVLALVILGIAFGGGTGGGGTSSDNPGVTSMESEEDVDVNNVDDADSSVISSSETHQWGDYIPYGTATIETTDGQKITAIANSLVLKTNEIEDSEWDYLYKGLDNPFEDEDSDNSDLISFAEMESVTRNGSKLEITDIDEEVRSVKLLDKGEVLFIGEEDSGAPTSVRENEIKRITFDRSSTPNTEIKYCTVTLDSGSYRSPVSFLWFKVNTNEGTGNAFPSMKLCQDLSNYSGIPLPVKRMQKLTVTKNGSYSSFYIATEEDPNPGPEPTEMTVKLTTGEEANITIGYMFSIYTMAANGALQQPSYTELRAINFE